MRQKALYSILILAVLSLMYSCSSTPSPTSPAPKSTPILSTVRINAGGPVYVDGKGQTWAADEYFTGGVVGSLANPIGGTTDDTLYQTERGMVAADLVYTVPVIAGTYQVTLKFAELFFSSTGNREFDVKINGTTVASSFDIIQQVGQNYAVDWTYYGIAATSAVTITLSPVADNPKISAIEIVPQSSASSSTWRVNAGGSALTDSLGNAWLADQFFSGGGTNSDSGSITTIGGVDLGVNSPLYQTERWGNEFVYSFPVPAGTYQAGLKFSELYDPAAYRKINVFINGTQAVTQLDVYTQAGGSHIPYDLILDNLTPVSGRIAIGFKVDGTSTDNYAKVSAVQLIPMSSVPTFTATPSPTNSPTQTPTVTPTSTATNSPTVTPTDTPTVTPTPAYTACPGGNTMGNGSLNSAGGVVSGYTVAGMYVCPAAQYVTHIKIRGGGNAGNTNWVGIYTNNSGPVPANKIAATTYVDGNYADTIDVPFGPVAMSAGVTYWLALSSATSGTLYYPYTVSASGTMVLFAGTMPSSYPGSSLSVETNNLSVQAFLCP